MAKKATAGKVEPVNAVPVGHNNGVDGVLTEDEVELLQVDVGDMVKLKQILDETVASAVLENVDEEYRLDNMKLGIMTSACVFACFAQFAPVPFPDSRPILGVCCCVYFLLSGLLQLITTFVDKDCILLTRKKPASNNSNLQLYGLRVRSKLPRYSEFYTVILEFQGLQGTPKVEQTWSVGNFFDVEGMFDEAGLMLEIEMMFKKLEAEKYESVAPVSRKSKKE
jgi:signal peptidase complex subunit 2